MRQKFNEACLRGDHATAFSLIENLTKEDSYIPLMREVAFLGACNKGDSYAVARLIDSVNIDFQDDNGNTALIIAAEHNLLELTENLIERGANLNLKNNDGKSTLIIACENFKLKIANLLVKKGADLDIQDNDGSNALIIAIRLNNRNIFNSLINKGANVNIEANFGQTALMLAAKNHHYAMAEVLIDKGANVNYKNKDGDTSLFIVLRENNREAVKFLHEKGADFDLPNNSGDTAYELAMKRENLIFFLSLKPEVINELHVGGNTLLMKAFDYKDEEVAMFLVDNGADLFIENDKGESAYKILKRKRSLPGRLQALKEKFVLDELINDNEVEIEFGL